jgi:hypothetical protein
MKAVQFTLVVLAALSSAAMAEGEVPQANPLAEQDSRQLRVQASNASVLSC